MSIWKNKLHLKGRGGSGQVVSVRALLSDDPSSNSAKVYNLNCCLKNEKRPVLLAHLEKGGAFLPS